MSVFAVNRGQEMLCWKWLTDCKNEISDWWFLFLPSNCHFLFMSLSRLSPIMSAKSERENERERGDRYWSLSVESEKEEKVEYACNACAGAPPQFWLLLFFLSEKISLSQPLLPNKCVSLLLLMQVCYYNVNGKKHVHGRDYSAKVLHSGAMMMMIALTNEAERFLPGNAVKRTAWEKMLNGFINGTCVQWIKVIKRKQKVSSKTPSSFHLSLIFAIDWVQIEGAQTETHSGRQTGTVNQSDEDLAPGDTNRISNKWERESVWRAGGTVIRTTAAAAALRLPP